MNQRRAIGMIDEAVTRPMCIKYYECMRDALNGHGIFTCIRCSWYKEIPH